MQIIPLSISDVLLIKPEVHEDSRGYFVETFRRDLLEKAIGHSIDFVQENESKSLKGVLRGLHFQRPPYAQSKLVRVVIGEVLDVAVDIRKGSPTYGQHTATLLNDQDKHQLYIPHGFAHGFVVLSDYAIFSYKVDQIYSPECDMGIAFDDPDLGIDWLMPKSELTLSSKDIKQSLLKEVDIGFAYTKAIHG